MLDVKTRRNLSRHKSSCRDSRKRKKAEILSRQGILCRDKKLKNNTGRILRHISLCCNKRKNRRYNLCHDTDYCNLEVLLKQCMKKFRRDKVMNVATLKDKFFGPNRETKS